MKSLLEEIGRRINADPGFSLHEQMQDDAFRLVLSQLPLREAVATRLLCPRWKDTWKTLPEFIFDAYNVLSSSTSEFLDSDASLDQKGDRIYANTHNFIHDVDSIVRAIQLWRKDHSKDKLDEVVISYFLSQTHSVYLDKWIKFALEAQTRCLRVHLDRPFYNRFVDFQMPYHDLTPYEFPLPLLGLNPSLKELYLSGCYLRPPTAFNGLSNLKLLVLCCIEITNDVLNRLLQSSHLLELLSLQELPQLVAISLTQPLGRLDTLAVEYCDHLEDISIQAKNLLHFNYIGRPAVFNLKGSPLLTIASIKLDHPLIDQPSLRKYFNDLSSYLPNLQDLVFSVFPTPLVTDGPHTRMFKNLVYFEWDWSLTEIPITHPYLATLLSAAPRLARLRLMFPDHKFTDPLPENLDLLKTDIPSNPHDNLKEVIVVNFYYNKWLVLLPLYLMKNARGLESLKLIRGPGIYDFDELQLSDWVYDVVTFLHEEAEERRVKLKISS